MLIQSAGKPLWYDELFVHWLATLPLNRLWAALCSGAEVHPPLCYAAAHLSQRLFGFNALASRLPSILAFGGAAGAILWIVRRRLDWAWSFAAALFFILTDAEFYATEARPYAILICCGAWALASWLAIVDGKSRMAAFAGILLSVAAAVSAQFLGILIPLPIVLGELWRTRLRRRVDLPVWLACGAGLLPILFYLPIMRAAQQYVAHNLNAGRIGLAAKLYTEPLKPFVLIAPLALIAMWGASRAIRHSKWRRDWKLIAPTEEWAAIVGFLLLPLALLALSPWTNSMNPRYTNSMVIGAALFFVYASAALFGRGNRVGFVCMISLAAAALGTGIFWIKNTYGFSNRVHHEPPAIAAAGLANLPIVVDQALQFMPIYYYNPELRSRLFFAASPAESRRTGGSDTLDLNLINLNRWVPLNVVDSPTFFRPGARFLLFASADDPIMLPNWEMAKVLEMGGVLKFVRRQNIGDYLFEAQIPPQQ